jgi:hypothetical protein
VKRREEIRKVIKRMKRETDMRERGKKEGKVKLSFEMHLVFCQHFFYHTCRSTGIWLLSLS